MSVIVSVALALCVIAFTNINPWILALLLSAMSLIIDIKLKPTFWLRFVQNFDYKTDIIGKLLPFLLIIFLGNTAVSWIAYLIIQAF